MQKFARPKFLNLFTLAPKMSVTGKVSILHRVSGVLLFLAVPLILNIFHKSLTSQDFYSNCFAVANFPLMKIIFIILIWAFMHHMCAGIRFLLLDIHKGIDKTTAKLTARIVLIVSVILTIILGAIIW